MNLSAGLDSSQALTEDHILSVLQKLNNENNKKELLRIVQDSLKLPEDQLEKISNGESFRAVGADSLDVVELVMNIEEAFKIEITDEDAQKMETLQKAQDYIIQTSKKGTLDKNSKLSDYNFDLKDLSANLKKEFSIDLPEDYFNNNALTIEQLCLVINKK